MAWSSFKRAQAVGPTLVADTEPARRLETAKRLRSYADDPGLAYARDVLLSEAARLEDEVRALRGKAESGEGGET